MNLLPTAIPGVPGNVAVTDPATYASGDFTALLAMLVGAASTTLPMDLSTGEPPQSGAGVPESPSTSIAGPCVALPVAELPLLLVGETPVAPAPLPPTDGSPAVRPAQRADRKLALSTDPQTVGVAIEAPAETLALAQPALAPARESAGNQPLEVPTAPAREQTAAAVADRTALPAVERSSVEPVAGPTPMVPSVSVDGAPRPVKRPVRSTGDLPAIERSAPMDVDELPAIALPRPKLERALTQTASTPAAPAADPTIPVDGPGRSGPGLPTEKAVPEKAVAEKAEGLPASKVAVIPTASQGSAHPVVPLLAATRSEALVPVDTPPPTPVVPASVPEQIVSAVVPLHGRGDGRHEVTLELRPDDLGTIRVEVSVEHQTVHVMLHAAEPATSRLLAAALPDLRAALADAGLTAGQVGVGVDGRGGAGHSRPQAEAATRLPDAQEPTPTTPRRPLAAAGRLDLFL